MKIITEFSSGNSNPKTKKEINRIFNKVAKLPNKKYDERNKLTSKEENYYYIHQKPDLLFIVLANNKYPERLVFELISKIQEENIPTMVNDETRELNPSGRQALKDLVTKYQDQKNINKIAEIQQNVDELKVDMRENINKMVQSVDDVNKLQEKSNALRLESEDYKKNSNELSEESANKKNNFSGRKNDIYAYSNSVNNRNFNNDKDVNSSNKKSSNFFNNYYNEEVQFMNMKIDLRVIEHKLKCLLNI